MSPSAHSPHEGGTSPCRGETPVELVPLILCEIDPGDLVYVG